MTTAGAALLILAGVAAIAGMAGRSARFRPITQTGVVLGAGILLLAAAGCWAVPASDTPPAESPTEAEKRGLAALHRNTVEIFIERPGFGIRRMVMRLDDVVTAPKSLSESDDGTASDRPMPEAKDRKSKPSHFSVQDLVTAGQAGRVLTDDKKEQWRVLRVNLVGLMKHPEPVVYLTDAPAADKTLDAKGEKETSTREPNEFEKAALAALRRGENLQAEKHGRTMHVLAPIYAGNRCASCHEKGQLLGAFSYHLERGPITMAKDQDEVRSRIP